MKTVQINNVVLPILHQTAHCLTVFNANYATISLNKSNYIFVVDLDYDMYPGIVFCNNFRKANKASKMLSDIITSNGYPLSEYIENSTLGRERRAAFQLQVKDVILTLQLDCVSGVYEYKHGIRQ